MTRRLSLLLLVFCLLLPHRSVLLAQQSPQLKLDPLLLAQAAEVWQLAASDNNPLWPDWNATSTPLLFYFPGVQEVLINHPNPPAGFEKYEGPISMQGLPIFIRTGETQITMDGQNTSIEFGGVQTLVVADTLSNRRNQWQGTVSGAASSGKAPDLTWDMMTENAYGKIGMIAHEAFHVHQAIQTTKPQVGESALAVYPTTSATNALGFALEGEALAAALQATDEQKFRDAVVQWLAIRRDRRSALPPSCVQYEDYIEYLEGLAKYIEYRLLQVLEGRQPQPAMYFQQGFHGYDNLEPQRQILINKMTKLMNGQTIVNNDPYGTASIRMRLYFSGMAIGAILDRLSNDWKKDAFRPNVSLTQLVQSHIDLDDHQLHQSLNEVRQRSDYAALQKQMQEFEAKGKVATEKALNDILHGPSTLLIIDYSQLQDAEPQFSYTPFGVLRVDDHRTIYRMVPVGANMSDRQIRQTVASPLLHDRHNQQLLFQLPTRWSADELRQWQIDSGKDEFSVQGVSFTVGHHQRSLENQHPVLKLLP